MIGRRAILAAAALIITSNTPALAQREPPLVGLLRATAVASGTNQPVFAEALRLAGHEDGRTIRMMERVVGDDLAAITAAAREIVAARPAAIIAFGPVADVLKRTTATIPIIALTGDPVERGLVASVARPGGNLTGVSPLNTELNAKRLSLLAELLPQARSIAVLHDGVQPMARHTLIVSEAARIGVSIDFVVARQPADIASALHAAKERGIYAVNVLTSPMLAAVAPDLAAAAKASSLPTICQWREMAEAGCLFSYGPRLLETYGQLIAQLDRVLKGADPAELPFVYPTRFELAVNLKTARALGLDIPPSILARADEVIE
jgi:putative tryptophan/tyrosine transport system substrate-binding protein